MPIVLHRHIAEWLRRFLALVIALCMAGVTLITRPPFLGFDLQKHISLLGVGFALGQVRAFVSVPSLAQWEVEQRLAKSGGCGSSFVVPSDHTV
jgi:hypothetical protein